MNLLRNCMCIGFFLNLFNYFIFYYLNKIHVHAYVLSHKCMQELGCTNTHTHLHQYTCAHPIELKANSSKASNGLSGLKFVKNIADSFAATKVTL